MYFGDVIAPKCCINIAQIISNVVPVLIFFFFFFLSLRSDPDLQGLEIKWVSCNQHVQEFPRTNIITGIHLLGFFRILMAVWEMSYIHGGTLPDQAANTFFAKYFSILKWTMVRSFRIIGERKKLPSPRSVKALTQVRGGK